MGTGGAPHPGWAGEWLERLDLRRWLVFSRARLRQGVRRARGSLIPILQAALGAAASWFIAHDLLGQPAPVFAPIATWVCLGFTENREPRKVVELGIGATVGVAVGEIFVHFLGVGWWQLALVLFVGGLIGRLLDRGVLFTMQSGVNSMVVVGMSAFPMAAASAGLRWLDALVGALVAFVIAVLLPRRPWERPRRYARSALEELAHTFDILAAALKAGDIEGLRDVRAQLRAVRRNLSDWEAALRTYRDVVRLNPMFRGERLAASEFDRLLSLTRRAVTTTDMLSRQSLGLSEQVGGMPDLFGELVGELGRATRILAGSVGGWTRPDRARAILRDVAARSRPAHVGRDDWRPVTLMSLVRAVVVDLLQATGLSKADARALLPDTGGVPYALETDERSPDDASELWGPETTEGKNP